MPQFLDAHERAFDHFDGHTREHLYDRPRTICSPDGSGGVVWNETFRSFARYWGFEQRLCRPHRARVKGKVESGVKYLKRNFLAGRSFIDLVDASAQWAQWNAQTPHQSQLVADPDVAVDRVLGRHLEDLLDELGWRLVRHPGPARFLRRQAVTTVLLERGLDLSRSDCD